MNHEATYREYVPHKALRSCVACYWSIRDSLPAHEHADPGVVVPDACMDFLFDLGNDSADVIGTMTRPLQVHRGAAMDLLGIRFRPGGIGAFLRRLPADRLTNGALNFREVWGAAAGELLHRVQEAKSVAARVQVLDQALLAAMQPRNLDAVVLRAAQVIEQAEGRIRVDDLARTVGLGRRQLERRFLEAVGIAPKAVCRVLRFQAARERMEVDPSRSLTMIALEKGYHDQAHMTRDFVALSGTSPGAWRATLRADGDAFMQESKRDAGLTSS